MLIQALGAWEHSPPDFEDNLAGIAALAPAMRSCIKSIRRTPAEWAELAPLVWAIESCALGFVGAHRLYNGLPRHPRSPSSDQDSLAPDARWRPHFDYGPESDYWAEAMTWWSSLSERVSDQVGSRTTEPAGTDDEEEEIIETWKSISAASQRIGQKRSVSALQAAAKRGELRVRQSGKGIPVSCTMAALRAYLRGHPSR